MLPRGILDARSKKDSSSLGFLHIACLYKQSRNPHLNLNTNEMVGQKRYIVFNHEAFLGLGQTWRRLVLWEDSSTKTGLNWFYFKKQIVQISFELNLSL